MVRIQVIAIVVSLLFLVNVAYLIHKGKLREEYAFIWIISTIVLIVFSFWREAFDAMAHAVGVYAPPNLIFTGAIFAIFIYLLHISVTVSKLQQQNKTLAQEHALLAQKNEAEQKQKKNA